MNRREPTAPEIAVVIPCYRVSRQILDVIALIPPMVTTIYCVDDACPEGTASLLEKHCSDPRLQIIRHRENQGVGGATISGYREALNGGSEIVVKVDGDGQMDPRLIPALVRPIIERHCDYAKGNRFFQLDSLSAMPWERLAGNSILSFLSKLSTGYWSIFDPTNGFVAIHRRLLALLPLHRLATRYFFETDMLFRIGTLKGVVLDVPMLARYAGESSNLKIRSIVGPFLVGHLRNLTKRIFYNYFLRDFNLASLQLVSGAALLGAGVAFGLFHWVQSHAAEQTTGAGTVMLSALPILAGFQLVLSFLNHDMASKPMTPVQDLCSEVQPQLVESATTASKDDAGKSQRAVG